MDHDDSLALPVTEREPERSAFPSAEPGFAPVELARPRGAPVSFATRLRSLAEVALCSGFPTQLAVAGVLALCGLTAYDRQGRLSAAYVFTLSLADAALVVGLMLGFLRRSGERPRDVLLGRRRAWRELLVGLAFIPVVFGVVVLVLGLLHVAAPWLHNVTHNPLEGLIRSPRDACLFALVTIVSGGFREEIQRGFILHRFRQHLGGPWPGLALSTLAFGMGHVIQGWDAALTVAALGAFWGVLYLVRDSIGASVVSHAGFDVAQVFRYTLWGV